MNNWEPVVFITVVEVKVVALGDALSRYHAEVMGKTDVGVYGAVVPDVFIDERKFGSVCGVEGCGCAVDRDVGVVNTPLNKVGVIFRICSVDNPSTIVAE